MILDGLARLRAADDFSSDDSRFVSASEALELVTPVWGLPKSAGVDELAAPTAGFVPKLDAVITASDPLTPEEKRARASIISRQVTLR